MKFQIIGVLAALALGLLLWIPACDPGWKACEDDIDCMILCDCPGRTQTVTVGPYPCSNGNCGARHLEDSDCVRVCGDAPPDSGGQDDDDSAGPDDDDSAADDDDSAAGDDDSAP